MGDEFEGTRGETYEAAQSQEIGILHSTIFALRERDISSCRRQHENEGAGPNRSLF